MRKRRLSIVIRLAAFLFYVNSLHVTADEKVCSSIDECRNAIVEQGLRREDDRYGMTQVDSSIARATLSVNSDVVEMLVELLKHQSFGVRRLAAYTLKDIDDIDTKYFADIKAALDNTPWLVRALGRIDSPEAAYEAVRRYSISRSAPHNGEAYAVKQLRERAVPFIVDFIRCKTECPENYVYTFGVLISELDVEKNSLVESVIEVITDESLSDEARVGAINILSFMESDALIAESTLTTLLKNEPGFEPTINNALIRIGTDRGIELHIEAIARAPDPYMIFELTKNGHRAKSAAPVLLALLQHDNFELKQVVVRALGKIGNPIAEEHLISMLNNDNDVVLNILAAQSLAELQSKKALIALELIRDSHWYPPVRMAAKDAIEGINAPIELSENQSDFPSYYSMMHTEYLTQKMCETVALSQLEEDQGTKLYKGDNLEKLIGLGYDTHVLGYGARDETDQILSGKEVIEVTPENMVEHKTPLKQIPDLALKVTGGWLVGASRGEWGGEIVFIGDDGTQAKVLSANVEDIYQLGNEIIATTGLAHLGSNSGMMFKLFRDENNEWVAKEWINLPGAPQSSWFVESGELLINVLRGGSILLSEDGAMRLAACSEI